MSAGWCIARGSADGATMVVAALAAVLAGDLLLYCGGRSGLSLGFLRRGVAAARLAQLERAFARHGVKLILAGRFVPGVRAAALVAAGAARMPLLRLVVCDGAAALVGAAVWITLGARLGPELERARAIVGATRSLGVAAAVVAALVVLSRRRWLRHPRRTPAR